MKSATMTPLDLSSHHRALVLGSLEAAPMSRAELVRATGLSAPTITRLVERMIADGQVAVDGMVKPGRGRPGERLRYSAEYGTLIAIRLDRNKAEFAVADAAGDEIHAAAIEFAGGDAGAYDALLTEAISHARAIAEPIGPVRALAVAVPGTVDYEAGVVLAAPNLGWTNHDVVAVIRQTVPSDVMLVIDNDVSFQAVGHRWRGQAQDLDDFVVVDLDEGLGAAVVSDGAVRRGAHGAAGEIGFLVPPSARILPVDGRGPLEQRCDARGVVQRWRDAQGAAMASAGDDDAGLGATDIIERGFEGDRVAGDVVDGLVTDIAWALVNIAAIIDPDHIVIDGSVGRALAPAGDRFAELLDVALPIAPKVRFSTTDNSIIIGATRAAMLALFTPDHRSLPFNSNRGTP